MNGVEMEHLRNQQRVHASVSEGAQQLERVLVEVVHAMYGLGEEERVVGEMGKDER